MMSYQLNPRSPSGRTQSIYIISRLHKQFPPKWEAMLRKLAETEKVKALAYAPLQRAIVAELKSEGKGHRLLRLALALRKQTPGNKSVAATSFAALNNFIDRILPSISTFEESFLTPGARPGPFSIAGVPVKGAFHARVLDTNGRAAYLYLHASEWTSEEEQAFIELLAILGEKSYGCERSQIWFVDLRNGEIRRPDEAFKRRRKELEATILHLDRLHH